MLPPDRSSEPRGRCTDLLCTTSRTFSVSSVTVMVNIQCPNELIRLAVIQFADSLK
jgi:hypothetical protein